MALYAFDGTSREGDIEDSRDTNVVRFARAYCGRRVYRSGVGTRYGAVGKVLVGWMGLGLNQRVGAALKGRDAKSKILRATLDRRLGKRQPKRGDRIHCSVRDRTRHQNPPERGCLVVDDHGEERGSYPGELDWPFEINWHGALVPTPRLRVGDSPITIDVLAHLQWNEMPHIYLERGGTYRSKVIDGPHDWIDGDVTETNGAEGCDLPALKPFKRLARMPDAGWMALVGAIDRAEHFRIGRQCDYQPQQDGELSCYPNDAWFKYRNTRGRLTLSVQRIA